jgi:hypothetical protein
MQRHKLKCTANFAWTCWKRANALHGKNESLSFNHQTAGGKFSFFANAIFNYLKNKIQ